MERNIGGERVDEVVHEAEIYRFLHSIFLRDLKRLATDSQFDLLKFRLFL